MRLDYNLGVMSSELQIAADLAKPFESCSLEAYWDPVASLGREPAGYPTQGWGHLLLRKTKIDIMAENSYSSKRADEWLQSQYPVQSQQEADATFKVDLMASKSAVLRLVKVQLSPNQLGALIDFTFNVGAGNLQSSTLLRYINQGDYDIATSEFVRWNKALGVVLAGLTRRRLAEASVFRGTL